MALVISENFDGVTAGAGVFPSDVTSSIAVGTTGTSTTFSLSGANSVYAAGSSPAVAIYSNKTDNSSGNCTVSGSVYIPTSVTGFYSGVVLSVGSQICPTVVNGNSYILISSETNGILLIRYNSTVSTQIGNINVASFTFGIWYTFNLTRNGSTLFCSCQRQSDLLWLSTTGTWQVSYIACLVVTDASPLSAVASYGGLFLNSNAVVTIYGDNLVVRDQVTSLPAGKIKGMNIDPAWSLYGAIAPWTTFNDIYGWTPTWDNTTPGTTGFILTGAGGTYTQIQLAKSAGCNCVRIMGALYGVWQGRYSTTTYINELNQLISYCQSNNLLYYLTENFIAYPGATPTAEFEVPYKASGLTADIFAQIVTDFTTVYTGVANAGHKNLFAFDLMNEFDGAPTTYTMWNGTSQVTNSGTVAGSSALNWGLFYRIFQAARTIFPSLPLTYSFIDTSAGAGAPGWYAANVASYSYLFDFLDFHVYYDPGATDSQQLYTHAGNVGTSGKALFVGEFGGDVNGTGAVLATTMATDVWANVVVPSYSGQPGCIGAAWWQCVPQNPTHPDYGMWTGASPAVARASESIFAAYSAQPVNFGNFRRRRR